MIPLKDRNSRKRFPLVTILLIAVNVLIFLYQLSLGIKLEGFFHNFSVTPNQIYQALHSEVLRPFVLFTLVTSLFMHGGWLHLCGDMLYLWIFGDNVEDKLGRIRFLFFYLLCGIAASALHVYLEPTSNIPTIGASGAISGVLGAYVILFPHARVLTLIPIFIFIQIVEMPAYIILGFWFALQFFNGIVSLRNATIGIGGVAWWAHIGGFIAGLLLVIPSRKYR